jgi:hypothetical protein
MTPEETLFDRLKVVGEVQPTAPSEGSVVEQELMKGDPDTRVPVTVRNLFTHHDAHPVVIDFALLRAFGLDWLGWEAETLWAEIHTTFNSQISELSRAKIQTVKSLHLSELPWSRWQVFEKVVQGLNNNIPRFDLMQAPTLEQLYSAIDIMDTIRRREFDDEVRHYIAAAVLHEDVIFVPPPLEFVQAEVTLPHTRCKDCGNEDLALFHDGICDTCTQKWTHDLSGRPDSALLASGLGKNTEVVLRFNPDMVQHRWEQMKGKLTAEVADQLEETAEDIQVAKLLVARDYMNVRRRQLADQLTALKSWLGAS